VGYVTVIGVVSSAKRAALVEERFPKLPVRILIFFTFVAPVIILPFTEGPRLPLPSTPAIVIGVILLTLNFIIKIAAQRQIGLIPALRRKSTLIATGIYRIVRHPLYISNGLLAIGMAVLFRSIYAILFSIPYTLLFIPIILFEEKNLLDVYGDEYKKYRKETGMIFPRLKK